MKIIFYSLLLSVACGAPSQQLQVTIANTVAIAANQAKPVLERGYAAALRKCVDEAPTQLDSAACRVRVEHDWKRIQLSWDGLARAQNEWATALEKQDAKLDDYVRWFLVAYCELRHELPPSVTLPDLALASCEKP